MTITNERAFQNIQAIANLTEGYSLITSSVDLSIYEDNRWFAGWRGCGYETEIFKQTFKAVFKNVEEAKKIVTVFSKAMMNFQRFCQRQQELDAPESENLQKLLTYCKKKQQKLKLLPKTILEMNELLSKAQKNLKKVQGINKPARHDDALRSRIKEFQGNKNPDRFAHLQRAKKREESALSKHFSKFAHRTISNEPLESSWTDEDDDRAPSPVFAAIQSSSFQRVPYSPASNKPVGIGVTDELLAKFRARRESLQFSDDEKSN